MPALPTPEELEASLGRDLLDRWFPACVDPAGGYRQRFGPAFEPMDDGARDLVFQSRMVWVCATMAHGRPEFAGYARHGVESLWRWPGAGSGALAWSLDAQGDPTTEEIHAYGLAFALYGLAAAGRRLEDAKALNLAKNVWACLEGRFHDPVHGGYLETTGDRPTDAIGTPRGQKSQNTHLHLLEALTELYRAWPVPNVRNRLEEVLGLFTRQIFAESGHLTLFFQRDWTPAATETSYGHDIEAVHLMLDAAAALGRPDDPLVLQRAQALADNVLAKGWDARHGGIYYGGDDGGPTQTSKNWWAQAEALLGFATLWSRTGDPRYAQAAAEEWAFIDAYQIDHERGGWHEDVAEDGTPRLDLPKGHAWKAAYHDGRALLYTARLLRALREGDTSL